MRGSRRSIRRTTATYRRRALVGRRRRVGRARAVRAAPARRPAADQRAAAQRRALPGLSDGRGAHRPAARRPPSSAPAPGSIFHGTGSPTASGLRPGAISPRRSGSSRTGRGRRRRCRRPASPSAPASTAHRPILRARRVAFACCPSSGPTRLRARRAWRRRSTSRGQAESGSKEPTPSTGSPTGSQRRGRAGRTWFITRSSGIPAARGAGARPSQSRRRRRPGDRRRAAGLAPDGRRRRRARRRDQPDALARRRNPPARPRRLPRRLDPLARLGVDSNRPGPDCTRAQRSSIETKDKSFRR